MQRALDSINEQIIAAVKRRAPEIAAASRGLPIRLVAVSKLKPTSSIIEAYECGQRYFGENYIQELETKSNSEDIIKHCPDIKFHFIGHLQSNKVPKLLKVRNLNAIETIDSIKLADLIDKAIDKHKNDKLTCGEKLSFADQLDDRLRVFIQVNTSGEEAKNGVEPNEAPKLAEHIVGKCRWLHLVGLMTIGRYDGWGTDSGPNKDFVSLFETRNLVAQHLSVEANDLELSMGMSGDFEEAIELGSTNVRVGSKIFGERPPKGGAVSAT